MEKNQIKYNIFLNNILKKKKIGVQLSGVVHGGRSTALSALDSGVGEGRKTPNTTR